MYPDWLIYQIKRTLESYWPAFKNHKNRKGNLKVLTEVIYLTAYWRCLPFHYFRYGLYNKAFSLKVAKNFIPETVVYYRLLNHLNEQLFLLDDKNVFDFHLRSTALPMPKTALRVISGQLLTANGSTSIDARYIKTLDMKEIIAKPANFGSGGKSIFFFRRIGDCYISSEGEFLDIDFLKSISNRDWIFQERVENSAYYSSFHPESLNSIRVMTFREEMKIHVLYATLKIGNNYAKTDNAHTQGIYVGINLESGELMNNAFDENLNLYDRHPITGKVFQGSKVESIDDVIQLAIQAAQLFPTIRFIGWDIAVTPDGPVILEGNSSPGLTLIQRTNNGLKTFYELAKKHVNKYQSNR